jgi:hypothetical protein
VRCEVRGVKGDLVSDEHDYNAAKALQNCSLSNSSLSEESQDQANTICRVYISKRKRQGQETRQKRTFGKVEEGIWVGGSRL